MNKNMQRDLEECKKYLDILGTITEELESNGIKVDTNKKHELVVLKKNKKDIESLIYSLPIPKMVLMLLIDIKEIKGSVHIRQIMK